MAKDLKQERPDLSEGTVALFVLLESSRHNGDYETAGRAIRELRKLGVDVKFHRPKISGVSYVC